MIKVSYQCREEGTELVNHEKDVSTYRELCQLVDDYPWVNEAVLSEKHGEGGALFFSVAHRTGKSAYFPLTPVSATEALMDLEVIVKPGILGVFGKKALNEHFDVVSIEQAKIQLKALFEHSIDSLYAKYKS